MGAIFNRNSKFKFVRLLIVLAISSSLFILSTRYFNRRNLIARFHEELKEQQSFLLSKVEELALCLVGPLKDLEPGRNALSSHSQYGQDKFIYDSFKNILPEKGYFVEFGARDGLEDSNSFFFDRLLHYDGILVEAVPRDFSRLVTNRGRKGIFTYHGLVCAKNDPQKEKTFIFDENLEGLGMLAGQNAEENKLKLKTMAAERTQTSNIIEIKLPCLDIQDIILRNGIKSVTLMSVDCEGCELAVLETFDFHKTSVSIILVEKNNDLARIMELLFTQGFIPIDSRSSDLILVNAKFLAQSEQLYSKFTNQIKKEPQDICTALRT